MKTLSWSIAFVCGSALAAGGTKGNLGVGFVLGSPSGLSAKIPMGSTNSGNLMLGYDWRRDAGHHDCCGNDTRLYVGGDYVWYNYKLIPVIQGKLPLYYGPGLWASIGDHSGVGVRAAVGLEYQFANAPFDIFLELGPGIRIIPDTDGDLSGGVGARFFF